MAPRLSWLVRPVLPNQRLRPRSSRRLSITDLLCPSLRAVLVTALPCSDRYAADWRGPQTQRCYSCGSPSQKFYGNSLFARDFLNRGRIDRVTQHVCGSRVSAPALLGDWLFDPSLGLRVPAGRSVWNCPLCCFGCVCLPVCAAFFGRLFSCLFLSCTAARALLRSPQEEPCVWWGTHRVQKPANRGRFFRYLRRESLTVATRPRITSGFTVAIGRSLRAWYAHIFLLFLLLSYPWFYAGNSTRIFKSISTGVHERLTQLDREHSWDCVWCKVGGWTPTFTNGLNCVWSTSAVGPRRLLTSNCHCWTVNTVWDCVSCNVGGWTPAFENFVQVVVVVLGLRVFASEACFTLGSHSSMVKLVVSL